MNTITEKLEKPQEHCPSNEFLSAKGSTYFDSDYLLTLNLPPEALELVPSERLEPYRRGWET